MFSTIKYSVQILMLPTGWIWSNNKKAFFMQNTSRNCNYLFICFTSQ